jgi:TonB-linked SusC/RagA family outer membrane protein
MRTRHWETILVLGACTIIGLFAVPQGLQAQNRTSRATAQQTKQITGIVTDSQGPLTGATVVVKGTSTGTFTDLDGAFSIEAPSGATLVCSFVGYITQEVKVGNQNRISIVLDEELGNINEVVVIGYGTQRRETVTGSVANIGGEKLNQIAATNAAQALQGRVAGVLMQQTSSQPGAEMQIRIRGQRSLNASNDPLIVLDGVPFMGNLSDINPSDIKSMDILKDASATAIYGSRGANGVIIITTIKGAQGTPAKVTYNAYVGFKKVFHKYPMMNTEQYMKMRNYAGLYTNSLDEDENVDTDWQDLFLKTGFTQSHDIGITGGTNGGSYSFGAGYYRDEAVIPTQAYDRYSIRGNFDQKVGEYFRFGLSSNTNYHEQKGTNVSMYGVLSKTPMINPYDADGNLKRTVDMPLDGGQYVWTRERLEGLEDSYLRHTKGFGSYNTLFAEVKTPWIEGLNYRINIGMNFRTSKTGAFTATGIGSSNVNEPNSASVQQSITKNWAIEHILTYDRTFAEKHHLNFTGLGSSERTTYEQNYMSGRDIPAEYFQYYQIGAAQSDLEVSPNMQNYWESGLTSWMGRIIYTYDNRYMLTAAFRSDASSRLADGHRWHTYPAVSLGWNIAREKFMEPITWLDNLKLRVGYGETSNQSIDPYSTLGALSTKYYNFGSNLATGYYVSTLPNPLLGWEYSSTWNYGLDYSLWGGRLNGTFEFYIQNTHELLLSVNLPPTSGVTSYMANIGKTRNKGFEFSLNGVILDNLGGWTWEAGINLYANRNELIELAETGKEPDVANRWFPGHPIDVIYDYKKIGLWQTGEEDLLNVLEPGGNAGMIKVEYTGDYGEDGLPTRQINTDDRQVMDMEPDLMGGFNTTLSYKHLDLTVIGAFQVGGTLISAIHSSNGYLNMLNGRRGQLDVDYWTEENTGAKYPKPGGMSSNDNPIYGSTLGYFDASYLKVRTITLGYNFEHFKPLKDMGISRLRLYATVQNPFVLFSPYNDECGLDPETNSLSNNGGTMAVTMDGYQGAHKIPVIGYNTPSTRNFIFGINLTF